MNKELTDYFKCVGADFDIVKKRVVFTEKNADGHLSRIIGYFLSDSINVFVYNINHGSVPDHGLEMRSDGRYLRVNCCKKGSCGFFKNGRQYTLSARETSMDYNLGNDGSFVFTAEEYIGVEVIMQVDKVITEHPILGALKKSVKRMALPDHAQTINSLYFVSESELTSRILDDIIEYCEESGDSEVIIVKVAELAYAVGKDLEREKKSKKPYVSGSQKIIAQEIHDKLTNHFSERWTVKQFAEKYQLSETTIKNYFQNVYGFGFKEYQIRVRMENAAQLLSQTRMSVGEIAVKCGYYSQAKFGAAFKKHYRATPLEYRRMERIHAAEKKAEHEDV